MFLTASSLTAAARNGAVFTLSTVSTSSIEEIAAETPSSLRFFQLYIYKDRYSVIIEHRIQPIAKFFHSCSTTRPSSFKSFFLM